MNLEGKHMLVVGASSGIGTAIALELINFGARLSVTTRDKNKLPKDWMSKGVDIFEVDVCDENSIAELVRQIGGIDGFVYTPGLVKLFPVGFVNQKQLDFGRRPIFDGAVLMMTALLRAKKINRKASLVFISSISSGFPYKGGAVYTSSKAALESYSKVLALELAEKGIRSNCIKAGLVRTKILEETKENMPEDIFTEHTSKYPLGLGESKDVANAVLFLLSDNSKWITGTEIILDGGLTAGA